MAKRYEPRELTNEQKNFRVDLHARFGGAFGYGETLEEAEKNARYFYKRDFGKDPVRGTVKQRWTENHWQVLLDGEK